MGDSLDSLSTFGMRVVWLDGIGRRLLLVRDSMLVIADSSLSADYVAMAVLAMRRRPQSQPLSATA